MEGKNSYWKPNDGVSRVYGHSEVWWRKKYRLETGRHKVPAVWGHKGDHSGFSWPRYFLPRSRDPLQQQIREIKHGPLCRRYDVTQSDNTPPPTNWINVFVGMIVKLVKYIRLTPYVLRSYFESQGCILIIKCNQIYKRKKRHK